MELTKMGDWTSRHVVQPATVPLAARALRRQAQACRTPTEVLDIAYTFSFLGLQIVPWQVRSELEQLLMQWAYGASAVVEIGTAMGGTLFALTRCAARDAVVVSIDLPGGRFGGGYPPWRRRLYESFPVATQQFTLIEGDSHDAVTRGRVETALGDRMIDVLLIDGDHTLDGITADFTQYARLVRPGGAIVLHDIVPQSGSVAPGAKEVGSLVGGVPEFWRRARIEYATREYVEDWNQGGFGLGVIEWPGIESSTSVVSA